MAENFLGALIADRRRQAGYSQADLARLLPGVSRSALNSIEGGTTDGCTRLRQPAKHLDLWPTSFKEARSAFAAPCLGVQKYLAGDAQFADWGRTVQLFIPFKVKIDAAMKALPDYSRGQLIRAIQDRQ